LNNFEEIERGAKTPLFYSSPSPSRERGIKGVGVIIKIDFSGGHC